MSSDGTKWHNLIQSWQVLRYPHKFPESAWNISDNNCTAIFYFQECCHLSQSIGHPHSKPIKPQQAGWALLSLCICCSGVMTIPVVSGCHWGPNGFHMPLRDIQLPVVENSCSHRGTAGISTWLSDNKWSLKLWNAHNNQSIPVGIIWSYVYQTPTTINFSVTTLNMDSHLPGNWKYKR